MNLSPEVDDIVRVNPAEGETFEPYPARVVDVMEWPEAETSVAVENDEGDVVVVMLSQLDEVDISHRRR